MGRSRFVADVVILCKTTDTRFESPTQGDFLGQRGGRASSRGVLLCRSTPRGRKRIRRGHRLEESLRTSMYLNECIGKAKTSSGEINFVGNKSAPVQAVHTVVEGKRKNTNQTRC